MLRAVPEGGVLRLDGTVLRVVCFPVHIPKSQRSGSPVLAIPRHSHLGVARRLLDIEIPEHARPQPDRPREGSWRGGGPCTHGLLLLRVLPDLPEVPTGTHHRSGLPKCSFRIGATQVLRPRGQTAETRGDPTGSNRQSKY